MNYPQYAQQQPQMPMTSQPPHGDYGAPTPAAAAGTDKFRFGLQLGLLGVAGFGLLLTLLSIVLPQMARSSAEAASARLGYAVARAEFDIEAWSRNNANADGDARTRRQGELRQQWQIEQRTIDALEARRDAVSSTPHLLSLLGRFLLLTTLCGLMLAAKDLTTRKVHALLLAIVLIGSLGGYRLLFGGESSAPSEGASARSSDS